MRRAASRRLLRAGLLDSHVAAHGRSTALARGSDHLAAAAVAQQHEQRSGTDQRARPLRDRLQDARAVGLAADGTGDLGRRLESVHGTLQRASLLLGLAVEADVEDRHRRPFGEDRRRLLVGGVEVAAGLLPAQVEVAVDLSTHDDRDAERALFRRMSIDEALVPRPILVEDPKRGMARPGQLAPDLDHLAQHRLEVELGDQAPADIDQPAKTMLVQNIAVHS